jgi:type IV secretion system protein VirB5
MKAQFDQLKALNEGFNKITNMGDVASLLNNPAIRSALPKTFSSVESSLRSGGGGGYGDQFASGNQGYVSPGNDFYATELGRQQGENAGQMGLASQMYDAATKRMEGMEQLRQELSQSADAKTTMDLQARLALEQTFLQIDINRMQALQMLQQAQWQVAQTREREELQKDADAYRRQFPEVPATGR